MIDHKKDSNDYTEDSYQDYETIYNETTKLLTTEGLKYATQKDIDQAVEKLQKAQDALVVTVSKDELNKLYTDKKDLKETDYTVDSWKAFKEALDHAKDVLQNENTTQDEVDQALASLQDAIKNLKTVSQTGNNDQPNQKPNDQIQTSTKKDDDNKTSSTKNNSHIKTGDDMSVVPYILLMVTAGGYIALQQRRNKED